MKNTIDEFLEREYQELVKSTGTTLPSDDCYCGVPFMPRWVRCSMSHKFNASCKIHDLYYVTGSIDNEDADVIFLDHMLMQAGESLAWRTVAHFMFLQVRVFQFFKRDFFSSFDS